MPIFFLFINALLLALNVGEGDVFLSAISAFGVAISIVWLFVWMDGF